MSISDLRLERLALDDLSPAEERALRAELLADPEAQARFDAIEPSNRALLDELPPDAVYDEVVRRLGARPEDVASRPAPLQSRPLVWAAAAACAALVALVLVPWGDAPSGFRTKGSRPALLVHRVLGADTEQLDTGDGAHAGERIQLSLLRAAGRHAVVVSVDGDGQVTLHYPLEPAEVEPVGEALYSLPRSYELDDAADFERFLLVTAPAPLDEGEVLDRARALAEAGGARSASLADLPHGAEQTSFLLRKLR